MKKITAFILVILIVASSINTLGLSCIAAETNFSCGSDSTWSLSTETKTLTISGSGTVKRSIEWSKYKEYIQTIRVNEGITVLDDEVFSSFHYLTDVYLPSTLIRVNKYVLSNNAKLSGIHFPNGSSLLMGSANVLYNSLYASQQGAGPVYLGTLLCGYNGTAPNNTTVTIKDGTLGVAYEAFKGQTGITQIEFPDSLTAINRYAFSDTAWHKNLPDEMIYAGNVFYSCGGISELNYTLTLREGTKGIAGYAFKNCTLLSDIVIPSSVIYIGPYAFYGTQNLFEITLPSSLKYIDEDGFNAFGNSGTFTIPGGLVFVGKGAFRQCDFSKVKFEDGYSINSITDYMFESCTNLKEIEIPECTKSIGSSAFYQCWSIHEITIPKSVESISDDNFKYMGGQNSLVISCYKDSAAYNFAKENGFQINLLEDEGISTKSLKSLLNDVLNINRDLYTADSLLNLDRAVNAVNLDSNNLTQDIVNEWEYSVRYALNSLIFKNADYSLVNAAIEKANNLNRSLFTPESLKNVDDAVNAVEQNLNINYQEKVYGFADNINFAIDSLIYLPADYSKINKLVDKYQNLDKLIYSNSSFEILSQNIESVDYTLNISQQSTVDNWEKSISQSMLSLEYAKVILHNEPNGIIVSATAKEIYPTTSLTVDILDPSNYEISNFAIGGNIKNVKYYDINLINNSIKVQPDGFVSVKIKIPDNVDPLKCRVYHVTNDPVDPLVRFASTLDGSYIVFETDHFSEFALIEVEPYLQDLLITQIPTKLTYEINDTLDFSDMEITAVMSDGRSFVITDYDISAINTSSIGTKTVTVYYTVKDITKSVSFQITVLSNNFKADITIDDTPADEINKKIKWYKLYCHETLQLGHNILTLNDYSFSWSSDNKKVMIDQNGKITNKGLFFPRKATISLNVSDSEGNVIATDTIIVRFFKFNFQLTKIQSAFESVVNKLIIFN